MSRSALRFSFLGLGLLPAACAGEVEDVAVEEEDTSTVMEAIIGGEPASATYPEAALLNMRSSTGARYSCSATVIAPTVVLTAGHCIDGMASWEIYVGSSYRRSTKAETFDWAEDGAEFVNPLHHDIGLVYLSEPIVLPSYPTLAQSKLPDGTKAVSVGRVLDGTVTNTLYDAPVTLMDGAYVGYPYDYASGVVIQHGDSGGPVFLSGSHVIAAVNSGAGSTTQVTARVDLLHDWIQTKIAEQTQPSAPEEPCTQETERNNSLPTSDSAARRQCGTLSRADVDWFTFEPGAGTSNITLTPTGDATMSVGYVWRGRTCVVALRGVRSVNVTVATKPITVCVAVSSPRRQKQSYELTR